MWRIQKGIPQLLGYASKTLPPACKTYSVTELEMFCLLINIYSWEFLVHDMEFDVAVDHQALVYIMKGKTAPATKCITRLLEKLSQYAFNLYYVKGKDLIPSDFLSQIDSDDSDPSKLIPISFMGHHALQDLSLNITRSAAKQAGVQMPPVHGKDKPLDPSKKPEHQPMPQHIPKTSQKSSISEEPRVLSNQDKTKSKHISKI